MDRHDELFAAGSTEQPNANGAGVGTPAGGAPATPGAAAASAAAPQATPAPAASPAPAPAPEAAKAAIDKLFGDTSVPQRTTREALNALKDEIDRHHAEHHFVKPTVKYHRLLYPLEVGQSAFIAGLTGHPRQGTGELEGAYVRTSTVVRVGENGEFETLNTVYQPE